MRLLLVSVFCTCVLSTAGVAAELSDERLDNWHRWRGPNATGVALRGNPPVQWNAETNIKWKVEIPGRGSSTPIVWGDQIFLLTAIKTDRTGDVAAEPRPEPQEQPGRRRFGRFGGGRKPTNYHKFVVLSIDRNTGRTRWKHLATEVIPHEGHHQPDNNFASGSPTTDGRFLYASFGSRGIYCYDLEGNRQWERDLGDMRTRAGFGEGSSPTVHGDTLIVNWDHEGDSFIVALDIQTGKTKWKVDRDERTSWATPLVVEHDGRAQVITNGATRVRSYDLANGDVIWECGGQTGNPIPSPLVMGELAICMTGFRGSAAYAIPLGSSGDLTDTNRIAWHHARGTPYTSSPLLYGRRLYFNQGNTGTITCLNPTTGEVVYDRQRLSGVSNMYASPVGAAGRVYLVGRDGTTVVIKDDPTFEVLAVNKLDDPIDASPAIVGRQMFLRSKGHLYCLEAE